MNVLRTVFSRAFRKKHQSVAFMHCGGRLCSIAIVDIWLSKRIDVQLAESLILDNQSNIKRENLHAQIMYEQE